MHSIGWDSCPPMARWDSRHEMAIGARATPQLLGCPAYGREEERSRRLLVSDLGGVTGRTGLVPWLSSYPKSNDISLAGDSDTIIEAPIPDVLRAPFQCQWAWRPAEAYVQEDAYDRHPFQAAAGWTSKLVHATLSRLPIAVSVIVSAHQSRSTRSDPGVCSPSTIGRVVQRGYPCHHCLTRAPRPGW